MRDQVEGSGCERHVRRAEVRFWHSHSYHFLSLLKCTKSQFTHLFLFAQLVLLILFSTPTSPSLPPLAPFSFQSRSVILPLGMFKHLSQVTSHLPQRWHSLHSLVYHTQSLRRVQTIDVPAVRLTGTSKSVRECYRPAIMRTPWSYFRGCTSFLLLISFHKMSERREKMPQDDFQNLKITCSNATVQNSRILSFLS